MGGYRQDSKIKVLDLDEIENVNKQQLALEKKAQDGKFLSQSGFTFTH